MPRERWARIVVWSSVALGFLLRARIVFTDDGIYWPDELYQSFEPAHRLVFGYGVIPWEYIDGARTWALPGLVALVLKVCSVLGLDRPTQYIPAVKLLFALASSAAGLAVYRLSRVSGGGERSSAAAAAAWALAAPVLYFAPRAMSENASAVAATFGLALVLDREASKKALTVGASLLGLAVLFRLQLAVLCVGVMVVLTWRLWRAKKGLAEPGPATGDAFGLRASLLALALAGSELFSDPRTGPTESLWSLMRLLAAAALVGAVVFGWKLRNRRANPFTLSPSKGAELGSRPQPWHVLLVLGVWAVAFGLLDALTWHDVPGAKAFGLFHSAVVYVRFNLIEGKAAGWGTAPWGFFFQHLWTSMPLLAALCGVASVVALKRAPGLVGLATAFFVLHALAPHKELRFLVPLIPLAFAALGVALEELPQGSRDVLGVPAVLVAALLSAFGASKLTFGDLGAYPGRESVSAWDDNGPTNRLMLAASGREDLCGLRIDSNHLAWTGGSTYLHKKAPLYMPGTPPQPGHFNYVITRPGSGAEVIARDDGLELVRIPGLVCRPDDGYSWRLP